jgi:hypothetical protein
LICSFGWMDLEWSRVVVGRNQAVLVSWI